ncbi:MAG: LPS translocon maturation chaperone LptM [Litorivicinus sp.]
MRILCLMLALATTACGNTGPLYLPEPAQETLSGSL